MSAVTPELINAVRIETGDTDPALPIVSDEEITYALNKYNLSVNKAWPQVASWILLKMSMSGDDSVVGILSLRGSKAAESYRLALELKLKNPTLNPLIDGLGSYTDTNGKVQNPIYAGGISVSDMQANTANSDNNYVPDPIYQKSESPPFVGPFGV
jgi:hypothetical protein